MLLSGSCAFGLTITSLTPSDYQITNFVQGTTYYTDTSDTITSVPLALSAGTLIRTESADGSNPSLVVSFNVDVRSEIYVCYDSRAATPSWLSSWVNTGMEVGVSNGTVGHYHVFAKRFSAGTVQLSANQASAMYFIVVKESLPMLPRKGWVLLSYDMPYLREIVKKAADYEVNMIQISHDIMMNTYEILEDPTRRANVNEIIDLAHAYGVTEVTLWTHEVCRHGMPDEYKAPVGHPAAGHADGNNPAMWAWIRQRYTDLLSAGTGCPEADAITLTFSEVDDNVYQHQGDGNPGLPSGTGAEFKHDGFSQQESVAMLIDNVQQVCSTFGKRLFARTWGSSGSKWEQPIIRDGILLNGDTAVWMMNKNVGGVDWPHMDTYQPLIGTLPPEYSELIEFDLGYEYYNKGSSTGCATSYLKNHWNHDLDLGADGAVARIDRESNMAYYKSNRLNIYALKEVLKNRYVDPATVNLTWCQNQFPTEIAQDIADHYDAPGSPWEGDTRYMMWEAYFPDLCPVSNFQALSIAYAALQRVDRHKPELEVRITLNTREGKNDFETLHNGIVDSITRLGGAVPDYIAPSVPTNVQAAGQTPTTILVTWTASTDNVGVTGYKIYRNGSQAGTSATTSYTDSGLTQNTVYSYRVSAYDAMANNSAQSSPPVTGKTLVGDDNPPSAPTNVQAVAQSWTTVQLTWTASTDNIGVSGYKIYRNGAQVGTSAATSYLDTGLQANTTYSYTVTAYDSDNNESAHSSPPATVTTPVDTQAPSVPTNVWAVGQSSSSIKVTWTASTDNVAVTGYKIYRNGSLASTSATTSYTDTGLAEDTTYTYTVSAYDASANESAQSYPPAMATVSKFCSVDLGAADVNLMLTHVMNSDGDTTSTSIGGLECRKPINTGDKYFYFQISDSFLYNTNVTTYLEVSYYDDQTSSVYMQPQYDAIGDGIPNMYRGASSVYFGNTVKWKTSTWTLTECKFANRQNQLSDFRLYVGAYSVKIDSVRISKVPFSDYNLVEKDLGTSEIYRGLSHPQNSDGDTVVATIGGQEGRRCSASGDIYFYFNVSDGIMYNGSPSTVYLRVEYYDSAGGYIKPQYDSTSNSYANATQLNFTGTNTWKTALWTLTDVKFANRQYVSADFRLSVGTAQNVYIDKVIVSKTPFDTQPPSVPTNVQTAAQSATSIQVTWTASTDNEGVTGYKIYRNGSQAGTSATTSYTDTGLQSGVTYSYTVSAYDASSNNSAQSSPPATATTPDNVPPSVPENVQATAKSPSVIHVTWAASTDNVGVTGYKIFRNAVQIRMTALTSCTDTALSPNTTYSYTVSSYDAVGNESAQSSPVTVETMTAISIADAKKLADEASAGMAAKTVTAVFADGIYVEETDRNVGMKIVALEVPEGLEVGKAVDVGGTMQTASNGERCVSDATVTLNGTGDVDPIWLNNKALGGGAWFYTQGSTAGQQGLQEYQLVKQGNGQYERIKLNVSGLNNVGLLIRVYGKVTYKGTDHFYVNDGSELDDNSGHTGMKVDATGLDIPDTDTYVMVEGISTCSKVDDDLYRLIRVRSQGDIQEVIR